MPINSLEQRTMDDGFDSSIKEEPKNQFYAREGTYKLVNHAEYSRTNRVGYNGSSGQCNTAVRVSFVNSPDHCGTGERMCFNYGRELYLYAYKGIKRSGDAGKPLDKRVYKNTSPTCHDFSQSASDGDSCPLLVGFSGGQIQLLDAVHKDVNRIFNDEQVVDKSRVTCVRWLPGSQHQFAVSHASGHLYVYNVQLPACQTPPVYQSHRVGDGFTIHTCKSRQPRNPQFRWTFGSGAHISSGSATSGRTSSAGSVNQFSFSPCGRRLAVVGGDGCLRVFTFQPAQSLGVARSYFGALTCVSWSPDGKYVAVGGEDDLVTVWSCCERRVAVRGRGHRSWVSDVAFDPVMSVPLPASAHVSDTSAAAAACSTVPAERLSHAADVNYRLGSVGQDTQLCLWDLGADVLLRPAVHKNRASMALTSLCVRAGPTAATSTADAVTVLSSSATSGNCASTSITSSNTATTSSSSSGASFSAVSSISSRLSALGFGGEHRRDNCVSGGGARRLGNLLLGSHRSSSSHSTANCSTLPVSAPASGCVAASSASSQSTGCLPTPAVEVAAGGDPQRLIGTASCPRLSDCPLAEPHVSCRVSHERLSFITFRDDCLVIGCSDGYVCTWARPGRPSSAMSGGGSTPVGAAPNGTSTVV